MKSSFRRLLTASRKKPVSVLLLLIFTVASSVLAGALVAQSFRRVMQALFEPDGGALWAALAFFLAVIAGQVLFAAARQILSFHLRRYITCALEDQAIEHYSRLAYWNLAYSSKEAGARLRQTVDSVSTQWIEVWTDSLSRVIQIISACVYALTIHPLSLAICLVVTVGMVLLSRRGLSMLPKLYERFQGQQGVLRAKGWEHIENHESSLYLNADRRMAGFGRVADQFHKNLLHQKKISNGASLFSVFGAMCMTVVAAVVGGLASLRGVLSISDVFALATAIPIAAANLFALPDRWARIQAMRGELDVMDKFFAQEEEIAGQPPRDLSNIRLSNLRFAYAEEPVLNGLKCSFQAGEVVCIAGKSGCGKSTLLKILAKLLPYEGSIFLGDGQPLNEIDREEYFRKIAYLHQDPVLLPGTIAQNVSPDGEMDEARIIAALKAADLSDWLAQQSDGIYSVVEKPSNGEMQKLCIARAIYSGARLFLMDEVTAPLDPGAEERILIRLRRMAKEEDRLVVLISHRHAVLAACDRVLFMQNGLLQAEGLHEKLMQENLAYQEVFAHENGA